MRPLLRLGRSEPLATESSFRSLLMGFVQRGLASPAMTGVVRPSPLPPRRSAVTDSDLVARVSAFAQRLAWNVSQSLVLPFW